MAHPTHAASVSLWQKQLLFCTCSTHWLQQKNNTHFKLFLLQDK